MPEKPSQIHWTERGSTLAIIKAACGVLATLHGVAFLLAVCLFACVHLIFFLPTISSAERKACNGQSIGAVEAVYGRSEAFDRMIICDDASRWHRQIFLGRAGIAEIGDPEYLLLAVDKQGTITEVGHGYGNS